MPTRQKAEFAKSRQILRYRLVHFQTKAGPNDGKFETSASGSDIVQTKGR